MVYPKTDISTHPITDNRFAYLVVKVTLGAEKLGTGEHLSPRDYVRQFKTYG